MKNKSLLSRLLDNKKIVLILSLVASFLFWIVSSDNTAKTITDINLNYSLTESAAAELKIFSADVDTVVVNVAGKRVIVDSLTADDIRATVDLSSVTEPGTGIYPIIVEPSGVVDFDVENIEPKNITIMVDREASKSVPLVSNFTYSPDGYYIDNNVPSSVEIMGPESLVEQVEVAYIDGNVTSSDASTVTNTYNIKLYNNKDIDAESTTEISSEFITMSYSSVEVTFRFLKIDENIPFTLRYDQSSVRLPSTYYSVTPSTLSVAGPEDMITGEEALGGLPVDIGSLSQYKNEIYNLTFDIKEIMPSDFINKSDGVESVRLQLDFSNLNIKTFDVPSACIEVNNLPEGYTYKAPSTYAVTVVGTSAALSKLDEESFTIVYDFADVDGTADSYVDVPVNISFINNGVCWVYRSSESASVMLEPV